MNHMSKNIYPRVFTFPNKAPFLKKGEGRPSTHFYLENDNNPGPPPLSRGLWLLPHVFIFFMLFAFSFVAVKALLVDVKFTTRFAIQSIGRICGVRKLIRMFPAVDIRNPILFCVGVKTWRSGGGRRRRRLLERLEEVVVGMAGTKLS